MSKPYIDSLSHRAMRLQLTAQTLQPYLWGVQAVQWDAAALQAGRLRLQGLCAIFRDGSLCDAPGYDTLPPPVDLDTLPSGLSEVTYYAALPLQAQENSADAPDQAGGTRKAVRLLSNLETHSGYECFPLLRLRRSAAGVFEPEPSFVPPSLSVAGAPRLKAQLERLVIALQAKAGALQARMRDPGSGTGGDAPAFSLLQTMSAAGATLTHYLKHPALHPERLFETLLALAGTLMPYSRGGVTPSLPSYQHEQPGTCLEQLGGIVRKQLDAAIAPRCLPVALTEERPGYYRAALDPARIGHGATLYLAVGAAMPQPELAAIAPLRVKAGAPEDVERCVQFAMAGVKLALVPQAPAGAPTPAGAGCTCYFILEQTGALYEQMLSAGSISIYVPAGMPDLRLELMAVAP